VTTACAALRLDQFVRARADLAQQLLRRQAVGVGLHRAQLHALHEAGDADLEEFVQVGRGDAQELEPLEQRQRLVLRLRQHAPLEFQQRQLAVEVKLGCGEVGRGSGRRRADGSGRRSRGLCLARCHDGHYGRVA
jgi:hypothetical protein